MLLTIAGILVLLWFVGVLAHIGGYLIYLLLVGGLIVFAIDSLNGRTKL